MSDILNGGDQMKLMLESIMSNNKILIEQFIDLYKQKTLWITKVITIASAVVGGVSLYKQPTNLFGYSGLLLLLICISIGLLLILMDNNRLIERTGEAMGEYSDYSIRALGYLHLSAKEVLSDEENMAKAMLEADLDKRVKEMGILNEDNSLGSVQKKILQNQSVDWANYILLIGFSFATALLILAEPLTMLFRK